MHRDQLPIPEPCHADWGAMQGDARKRFCQSCTKHVHDLSAMTEPEAKAVLQQPEVCVRYTAEPDGAIRFKPSRRRRFASALAAAAGVALALPQAGCGVAQASASSGGEPGLIEQAATAIHDLLFGPSEGCDLTQDFQVPNVSPVLMGEPMPILEPPEPEPEVLMGDPAPPEPLPPTVMGGPRPTPQLMGKIAMPEPSPEPSPEPAPLQEVSTPAPLTPVD
ncbi:MAG: hypothetical protein H6741_11885 [Alphaproteobacteria bacterium]|nr:hypothetical protein [Alphaproteobacteria bacterium]MCB9793412.1 hypothetical protein [Alphaproteobacteria bacterium]